MNEERHRLGVSFGIDLDRRLRHRADVNRLECARQLVDRGGLRLVGGRVWLLGFFLGFLSAFFEAGLTGFSAALSAAKPSAAGFSIAGFAGFSAGSSFATGWPFAAVASRTLKPRATQRAVIANPLRPLLLAALQVLGLAAIPCHAHAVSARLKRDGNVVRIPTAGLDVGRLPQLVHFPIRQRDIVNDQSRRRPRAAADPAGRLINGPASTHGGAADAEEHATAVTALTDHVRIIHHFGVSAALPSTPAAS